MTEKALRQAIFNRLKNDTDASPVVELSSGDHSIRYLLNLEESSTNTEIASKILPDAPEDIPNFPIIIISKSSMVRHSMTKRFLTYYFNFYIHTEDETRIENLDIEKRIIDLFENKSIEVNNNYISFSFINSTDGFQEKPNIYPSIITFKVNDTERFIDKDY